MMLPFYLRAIAEATASGILICVAGGIPIALFAWILLRVFGRQESGTRFAVCFSALLAIALLPAFERLRTAAPNVGSGPGNSLITISSSWAAIIFALWALFATIGLARVVFGFLKLQRLRASCTALNSTSVNPILQDTLREFDSARLVRICVSDGLRVPTAIGFLKPMVILPSWALNELSPSELRAVLLHELAHLKRWDDWTNLVQKLVQAALFFHPAVWWIENRLSLEREMACDDIVLAHTENPRAYAQCLLSIAEKSFMRRGFSLAQAVVNRMRQTSLRISQILDSKRSGTIDAGFRGCTANAATGCVPRRPESRRVSGQLQPSCDVPRKVNSGVGHETSIAAPCCSCGIDPNEIRLLACQKRISKFS
jgi:beta-lactamase regulating signal transducer with metallopeptidase domain